MIDSKSCTISRYPVAMSKYGLIPSEDQMSPHEPPYTKYRLIWSTSRVVSVFRTGLNGSLEPADVPVYVDREWPALSPQVGECWVLEKWISCQQIAGMTTEEEWNSDPFWLGLGSYPKHGWYEYYTALSCNPGDANLDLLISVGQKRVSAAENYQSIVADQEAQKKERKRIRADRMDNAFRPWGADAYVAYGGAQGSKTGTCIKSAQELGLPIAEGSTSTFAPKDNQVYEYKVRI